jgi:hypothetical protein
MKVVASLLSVIFPLPSQASHLGGAARPARFALEDHASGRR